MSSRMSLKYNNTCCCVVLSCLLFWGVWYFFDQFSRRNTASAKPDQLLPKKKKVIPADLLNMYENGYTSVDNEDFLDYVRDRWLVGTPSKYAALKLSDRAKQKRDHSQVEQSSFLDRIMRERRNGFFVECGAADGETFSNTLFFEQYRSWSGLLVEPNPVLFDKLLGKNRNSSIVNSCLSTSKGVEKMKFTTLGLMGGIPDKMEETHLRYVRKHKANSCDITVTCFPLHVLLRALDVNHVDYFSLDVEGPELDILKTIPFNEVTIDYLSIEYRVSDMRTIDSSASLRKLRLVRNFFSDLGNFQEMGILPWNTSVKNITLNEANGLDVIFKRVG